MTFATFMWHNLSFVSPRDTINLKSSIDNLYLTANIFLVQKSNIPKKSFHLILTSLTQDAVIYYTNNGSEPNQQSSLYTEPIFVLATTTVKARAYKPE
jgi:hypothetical protein